MSFRNIAQFATDLHQEVLTRSGDGGSPQLREETFTQIVLDLLSEHNEADGAELCTAESRGSRKQTAAKINAWALSGDGATLDLFVTRYGGTGTVEDVGRPDARRHFEMLQGFLKRALEGGHTRLEESSDAFLASARIFEVRDVLSAVRLFLLSDGVIRSPEVPVLKIPTIDVRPVVWDLEKLSRLKVGQRQTITIDFVRDHGGPLTCIHTQDAIGEYRTFLAFLQAPQLAKIYGEHGQRLLERNVRAFLQAKGKVNRGLQKTIREEPTRFLAYNNGLCCTAAEVDVHVDQNGHASLRSVRDFQIVNGGQTTASIFHALRKEKEDIRNVVVQMKLTVISDSNKVAEIVPLISQYANSQNKVNTADFSANGPFHHGIERLSRTCWAPAASGLDRQTHWYYERARGSYADDRTRQGTPARQKEWEKQNPPQQKFTKTDLAKFELTWLGLPQLVCLGAEKAFLRHAERMDEEGGSGNVDVEYFHHLVAKAILFRGAEKIFSAQQLEGYRAQSVAYGVAWLAERSGQRLNLDWIWEQQKLPDGLKAAIKVATGAAHAHIVAQQGNPGEVSKRESCWDAFRETDIGVGDAWLAELAESSFLPVGEDEDALSFEWERLRHSFLADSRTMGELEVKTGKQWVNRRRKDPISMYAKCTWRQLKRKGGLGPVKIRGLVDLLAAAKE